MLKEAIEKLAYLFDTTALMVSNILLGLLTTVSILFLIKDSILSKILLNFISIFYLKLQIGLANGAFVLAKLPYITFERKTPFEEKLAIFEEIKKIFSQYSEEYDKIQITEISEEIMNINNTNVFSEKLCIFFNNIPVNNIAETATNIATPT